jgi:hypothetical protein
MQTSTYTSKIFTPASATRRLVATAAAAVVCLAVMSAVAPLAQARKMSTTYTTLLGPATATNPIGANHTLTATVIRHTENCDPDGGPLPPVLETGATVKFEVTSGPNKGLTGTDTTDSQGQAHFTYTSAQPGTDKLVATPLGLKNAGECNLDTGPAQPSKEVEAIWTLAHHDGTDEGTSTSDGLPQITINDVRVTEGNSDLSPATPITFTVSLSKASPVPITVDYATADGSATMAYDYVGKHETLTFAPGDPLSQKVTIDVRGDHVTEADEWFAVNLSNPTNAQLADPQGIGTIVDDDPLPMS